MNLSLIFNELYLKIIPPGENGEIWKTVTPTKLPMMPNGWTPYTLSDNNIFFSRRKIFTDCSVKKISLPDKNTSRYLKGYSFPFIGTAHPFYELRINPKNTGHCPGQCRFCHRYYSSRIKPNSNKILSPEYIINQIETTYGHDVFEKIDRVLILTELFGHEEKYIDFLYEIKSLLNKRGYSSAKEFAVSSQDIRSKSGMKRLYNVTNPKRFSYTLEVFSDRQDIMSKYKGIAIEKVLEVLSNARNAGFQEIQINYVSGLDSIAAFEEGLKRLKEIDLIDSIGFNVFTSFFSDQISLRSPEAWSVRYYHTMSKIIKRLEITFYKPTSYEMGTPFWI